jgi:hypothetical protein
MTRTPTINESIMRNYTDEEIEEAKKLREFMEKLCNDLPNDFIVIGGWAVDAYNNTNLTFDGDAMVSIMAHGILKDSFDVTPNPRMKKHQFVGETSHDIDIYVEYQHGLKIPYDELKSLSQKRSGLLVACPEHLIILKLEAAQDRVGTSKGEKDILDLLALISLPKEEYKNIEVLNRYLSEENVATLKSISTNQSLIEKITKGNKWEAKSLKSKIKDNLDLLLKEFQKGIKKYPDPEIA